MEQRTDGAYSLNWEFDHIEFYGRRAEVELWEFPGSNQIAGLIETTPIDIPEPVVFIADFQALTYTDYPISNVYWPIMSRRMYYVLNSIGNFAHRVIPVAMVDDTAHPNNRKRCFLPDGKPNPKITNSEDFVVVQILQESDYFDFEYSEYQRHPRDPDWIRSVSKYVLNKPPEGFPPLFRLSAYSGALFISAEAREALKDAGIRGIAYELLDNPLQEEVDIPVQLPTHL